MKTRIASSNGSSKSRTRRQSALRNQWQRRQRRILQRLDKHHREAGDGLDGVRPVMQASNVHCEVSERHCGTAYGGVAVMHQLVRELGLVDRIDKNLQILLWHKPYLESDHVLNFAYNAPVPGNTNGRNSQQRVPPVFFWGWRGEQEARLFAKAGLLNTRRSELAAPRLVE